MTRGDTLFAISRNLYPGDTLKQKRVREDITRLNPAIFANGVDNLAVGVVLKLPDYVVEKSTTAKSGDPVYAPKSTQKSPSPQTATPALVAEPKPEPPAVVVAAPEPEPPPVPVAKPEPEPPPASRQSASASANTQGAVILGIGYSFGGDELVEVDSGLDFNAGSGGHLRLGYERMSQQGRGYRAALGLQYNKVDDSTYKNTYLQLAYQLRNDPLVYGIGIVADTGASLESFGETTDFDPGFGGLVYMEYLGNSSLNGLGLSYTAIDIDEEESGTSVDASRIEIYYNWRF